MASFGHLTCLMKKSNPFLQSVQSYLQSEMFLSNSVDMMKNSQRVRYVYKTFVDAIFPSWEGFMIMTMLFSTKSFIKSNTSGEPLLFCKRVKEQSALCTFKIFYQIDHLKLL